MEEFRFLNAIKGLEKDQRGIVLVFSVMVLIMIAMWGAATLTLSTNDYHIANSSAKAIQAYYLAEAGLEEGIAKIRNDNLFVEFSGNMETGSYVVSRTGSIPGTIIITSVGKTDDFQKTLTGVLEITAAGGPPSCEDAKYCSEGSLTLGSSETINGDIYAGDSLVIGSDNDIDGDIFAGGSVVFNSYNDINGNIFVDGSLVFNTNTTIKGNIFVKGDLVFDNNTVITGNIYVIGSLTYHEHFSITGNIFDDWDGTYPASQYDLSLKDFN